MRGDNEEAGASEVTFPLVAVRDMAELIVPSEAGLRVDRGEGCSCDGFWPLLGVDLVGVDLCGVDLLGLDLLGGGLLGVVAGVVAAVSTGTTVTDERSKAHPVSMCWPAVPGTLLQALCPWICGCRRTLGTHPNGTSPSLSRGALPLPQGYTVCRLEPQRGNPRGGAVRMRAQNRGGASDKTYCAGRPGGLRRRPFGRNVAGPS